MIVPYYPLVRAFSFAFLVVAMIGASACAQSTGKKRLHQAAWLLGEWKNNTPRGILYEAWQVKNDSTYAGKSSFVVGTDTVSSETVELGVRGGKLLYIPTVRNQNNGQPVTFTETTVTAKVLVFENPAHDFPQRITYTQVTSDSLVAVISGKKGEKEKAIQFPMRRIK
jgi:hypothetical protein